MPVDIEVAPVEETAFGPLQILFDARVLRPRAWTVAQSHLAARLLTEVPAGPVLELCAGAGQIGLLAVRGAGRRLVSVDLSPVASAYTRCNALHHGLHDQVVTVTGAMDEVDLGEELFPLVIADPPYLPTAGIGRYPEDPASAIDGGADGMDLVRTVLRVVRRRLHPDGVAVLQLATSEQARQVQTWLRFEELLRVDEVHEEDRGVLVVLRRETAGGRTPSSHLPG